jgi:hypothetical protein
MKNLRKIIPRFRKNSTTCNEVYSGESIFDYILDLFPSDQELLKEPIFLIGCARSGTTITFSFFQHHPRIACLYEANKKWMNFFKTRRDTDEHGDLLYPSDATTEVIAYLRNEFNKYRQRVGRPLFAEKDPRNSIRLDFVYNVFPDAKFVILFRNPYSTICSLMKRHEQARKLFRHKKKENQWWRSGDAWAEQRIPGWKQLRDKSIFEAAITQYSYTMRKLLKDIKLIPSNKQMILKYENLFYQPEKFQESLYEFISVPYMSETKSVLNKIHQPSNNTKDMLTNEDFDIINNECQDIFLRTNYEIKTRHPDRGRDQQLPTTPSGA